MGKKTPYIGPQNQPVGGILRVPGLAGLQAGYLTEPAGLGAPRPASARPGRPASRRARPQPGPA